mmetsp:Transcript_44687/g.43294  ORF Transcript_44687/g.43294 Transcript_44687/m.43294 type:complete len:82 (+) Transcript_44687:211-456(+)|eukprot:CAMPEP_0170556104 /NCGR_PEP_ID=MMETSP0211-20121228/15691_1 /TAXON_ID=311385 /ORGANISM="Pseudokeronopsis sp., Strain OXSARD2" /LENGTH=81 /DNA_ID=CAMNT_0010866243 /DNA_START=211 /DNA_END=456 /DNA_ORIENTATION=+
MEKLPSAYGGYDDGIYYYFGEKTPGQIKIEMSTDSPNVESCDVRLTTVGTNQTNSTKFAKTNWTDVAFYRFGYFNYQKLNL